jgi:RNA polymerase sigma factor for flagellar operon FliA
MNPRRTGEPKSQSSRGKASMTPQRQPRSRNEWVVRHLPLVRSIVYGLRPRAARAEMDDLVSAGTVGLMEAAARFDARRGVPFASFAYSRIRGAVVDELRCLSEWNRMGASAATVEVSLQAPVDGDRSLTFIDVIPDRQSPEPESAAHFGEVVEAIGTLPSREREILGLYTAGHTVAEIAASQGCSESRASQIVLQARLRLEQQVA